MTCLSSRARQAAATETTPSPQRRDGKFRNVAPRQAPGFRKTLGIAWRVLTQKPKTTVPRAPIPVQPLDAATLAAAPDASLFRLGHSTLLLKLAGEFWLTDPVFSERASPVQWAGPKRFHASPISIADLPPIKGVILSHDHYDHLDHAAVLELAPKVEMFITPLGVGDRLVAWGIPAAKVRQLDWWQQTSLAGVRLVATPAQVEVRLQRLLGLHVDVVGDPGRRPARVLQRRHGLPRRLQDHRRTLRPVRRDVHGDRCL